MTDDSSSQLRRDLGELRRQLAELKRGQQETRRPSALVSSSASLRAPDMDSRGPRGDDMRASGRTLTSSQNRHASSSASPAPLRSRTLLGTERQRKSEATGSNFSKVQAIRGHERGRTIVRSIAQIEEEPSRSFRSQVRSRSTSPQSGRVEARSRRSPQPRSRPERTTQRREPSVESCTEDFSIHDLRNSRFFILVFKHRRETNMRPFVLEKHRIYVQAHFRYTEICIGTDAVGRLALYVDCILDDLREDEIVTQRRQEALLFLRDWNNFHIRGMGPLNLREYYDIWSEEAGRPSGLGEARKFVRNAPPNEYGPNSASRRPPPRTLEDRMQLLTRPAPRSTPFPSRDHVCGSRAERARASPPQERLKIKQEQEPRVKPEPDEYQRPLGSRFPKREDEDDTRIVVKLEDNASSTGYRKRKHHNENTDDHFLDRNKKQREH